MVFQAYSDTVDKLFEGELTNDSLPEELLYVYGDCLTIYSFLREAIAEKNVTFSDNGELKFKLTLGMGVTNIRKEIVVILTEAKIDETTKLKLRISNLEAKVESQRTISEDCTKQLLLVTAQLKEVKEVCLAESNARIR